MHHHNKRMILLSGPTSCITHQPCYHWFILYKGRLFKQNSGTTISIDSTNRKKWASNRLCFDMEPTTLGYIYR